MCVAFCYIPKAKTFPFKTRKASREQQWFRSNRNYAQILLLAEVSRNKQKGTIMDECIFITNFNFMRASNTFPLTTHTDFPLSIQPLNLSPFCYSAYSCPSPGFTLEILCLSYCSCINCLLSSLWLVWILRPLSSPSCFAMRAVQLRLCLSRKYPPSPPSPSSFKVSDFPSWQPARGCTPRTSRWVCSVTTGPDSPPASWVAWK